MATSLRAVPAGLEPAPLPLFTVKDLLWFAYLYPFRMVAGWLPRGLLYALAKLADPLVQFRSRRQRSAAEERMVIAGIPAERAPDIARRFVSNAAVRILDDLLMSRRGFERTLRAGVDGLNYLDEARARQKGVLLLSVHTYGSRMAKRYLASVGYPILTVRNQKPPDALAGKLGLRFLQPRYMDFLHRVIQDEVYIQDPECTLKILKRLRSGGLVNIHLDARPTAKALESTFLESGHAFSRGPFDILRISNCAVVPMFSQGRGTNLRIAFGAPVKIAQGGSSEEFAYANLRYFVRLFEEQIMTNPEEWELWTRL